MAGMDRNTGRLLDGRDHLIQSIGDIVSTRLDTRVLRRWYGSDLPGLIDAPIHDGAAADFVYAVADSLGRFEDRIVVSRIAFAQPAQGRMVITVEGADATGARIYLDNIPVGR